MKQGLCAGCNGRLVWCDRTWAVAGNGRDRPWHRIPARPGWKHMETYKDRHHPVPVEEGAR